MAFFPCIYFTGSSNPLLFSLSCRNYHDMDIREVLDRIIERSKDRECFYGLLVKMIGVALKRGIPIILENPYSSQSFLCNNFLKNPDVIDNNRMVRGDYFVKPTGYWFFNCEPNVGMVTFQKNKKQKIIRNMKSGIAAGICSEERSMISPDYARNFICDFILGKPQSLTQMSLF